MKWEWHRFFDGKVSYDHDSGCIRWTKCISRLGYGQANRTAGEVKTHRISWALMNGAIPNGLHVLHECDVRACVNPFHLSVGTHADNMAAMSARGRGKCPSLRGADNPMAVLDDDKVWAIRAMLKAGAFSQAEIAKSYKIAPMTVSVVARNKSWRHITPDWPFGNKGSWQ